MKKITASVLAFEKKLVPSSGYLYGTNWENRFEKALPLALNEKSVRGTISNRLKKDTMNDPAKLDAAVEKANLQVVDSCSLGITEDTLNMTFTLRILGNVGVPSACNNSEMQTALTRMMKGYASHSNYEELGIRYATNLANGRFFWRNRVGAEQVEILIRAPYLGKTWTFNAYDYSLNSFDTRDEQLLDLAKDISSTFSDIDSYLFLEISAFAQIGFGQEVYPSEELVLGKQKNDKSKILFHVDNQAALHSQKIGNALRTIDTWYPEDEHMNIGPIAAEPYGAVTNLGKAFRNPSNKKDFFSLFDRMVTEQSLPDSDDEHYVVSVLIRGGVFGEKEK